jgi:glycerol kinase
MQADVVLAIDQGTTGTTVVAVDRNLHVIAKENKEFRQIFPKPGWVEHDLEDIWTSTTATLQAVLARVDPRRVAAIGITNQRETVGVWDRTTSRPIHNAVVWQCRRTTDRCQALKAAGHEARIREQTGLVLDPYFSGTKAAWILDHVDGARKRAEAGELAAGTIDTFLVWRLTGGAAHVTDVSNASRTMLFDLHTLKWGPTTSSSCSACPRRVLAEVQAPRPRSTATPRACEGLPDGIPIAGMAGDQQAALVRPGLLRGRGGQVHLRHRGLHSIEYRVRAQGLQTRHVDHRGWQLGPQAQAEYALEGSVFLCGAAVQWLRDGLKIIKSSSEVEALAGSVPDSGTWCSCRP